MSGQQCDRTVEPVVAINPPRTSGGNMFGNNEANPNPLYLIAEILAEGVLRRRFRDIRKVLKTVDLREKGLEVSSPKSLHGLEPRHGEENR